MFLATFCGLLLALSLGASVKFYLLNRAKISQTTSAPPASDDTGVGPTNSVEAQNRTLQDEVDQLKSRLSNAAAAQAAPREIDKKNPALALFSPVVVDHTQDQHLITIANIKSSQTKDKGSTLMFELHNAHEGESTEKGYIVVLGRGEGGLYTYPNTFNQTGPYLLDFEKGETFQVARFRMVNAQFSGDAQHFQILIFTRNGQLLINAMHEVKAGGA